MNLLMDGSSGWTAALLPVAAGLLLEELFYGGLVRLLLAPWPGTTNVRGAEQEKSQPGQMPENRRPGEGR